MDDNGIIELFFSRSEQAIEELRLKYGRLCAQIARGILHNEQDVEEIVSLSYLNLWNAIPPKRPESLRGYLCRTVRNAALNTAQSSGHFYADSINGELAEILPDASTVESVYDSAQIARYINEFLQSTAAKPRIIFVMRYYYNQSVKQIAHSLSMNENAVKTQLSRTRAALRKHLTERGVEI
ncbi:MAG: RNA polymerase sigma factor [Oscillospiraceae bacterium]